MGRTIDEDNSNPQSLISGQELIDLASEVNNYLPKDPSVLTNYIRHLWGAFVAVVEKEEPTRAFGVLPFHLLFMFAVQYKVYRISAHDKNEYLAILNSCGLRDPGVKRVLEDNSPISDSTGNVPSTSSVRNLSLLPEKRLFDFLRIIKVDDEIIVNAQNLVDIRSTYAHANGNIEEFLEAKIEEYLEILRAIQLGMVKLNDLVAEKWLAEIEPGEAGEEYIQLHLAEEFLCPADVQQGELSLLYKKSHEENYNQD